MPSKWSQLEVTVFLSLFLLAAGLCTAAPPSQGDLLGLSPATHLHELNVTHWTVDDGLPGSTLNNVLRTTDGYLWISSFNGLVRFDGHRFEIFDKRTVPVFETSGFHHLIEDKNGDLWIGMQSVGPRIYRDGEFQRLPWTPEVRATVRAMVIDDSGEVWIGTIDHGVYRSANGHWLAVEHPSFANVAVRNIIQDRSGTMWLATEGKGLVEYQDGRVAATYTVSEGLVSNAVTGLVEGADGRIWVGSEGGLNWLQDGEIRTVDELNDFQVFRLYQDDYGSLWVASEQGLLRRNAISMEWEHLDSYQGEPLRRISAIAFDREGAIWLASYGDGLYQLQEGKFDSYTLQRGLTSERITAVHETSDGRVLVGGDGGSIDVVHSGTVDQLDIGLDLPDVRIRGFLEDSLGRLWIASYVGLLRVSADGTDWLTTEDGLPSDQMRLIYEDRAGKIWAATRNAGLVEILADGSFRTLDRTTGLTSNFILSIDEGSDGELLLGTHEGLSILHRDGSTMSFGTSGGLPGEIVFSTFVDDTGAIWLATNGGLGRLDRERESIRTLTLGHGLPAEAIFDYQEDANGSVWLTSAKGVIRVAKQQLTSFMAGDLERVQMTVYDDRDGLASRDCTGAAKILEASDGKLWIPTLKGVSVLDPDAVPINEVEPPVRVHRFAVDDELLDLGSTDILKIAAGKRFYTFEFTALSLLIPSKVRIQYKLEGFDDDWQEVESERSVRYTNLARGFYAFRVRAANNDGVWNEQGARLEFEILPFFYQTPWFLVLLGLSIVAGARAVYSWRMKTVQARNRELKESESRLQRLVEELEQKNAELERFTYTASHDLKSPLVTVQGFLGLLEQDVARGDQARIKSDVQRISSAVETMGRLLEDLLSLSRTGRLINPPEPVPLVGLVRDSIELLDGEITERGIEIEVGPELPVLYGDRTRLSEVALNLLANAVKFIGDSPRPRVEIGVDSRGICFVRDNGIGIEPRYHDKIFGLFERLDSTIEGTGIGLALVKRIVEIHGGRIWVESDGNGQGSTFFFDLPRAPADRPQ